jgi:hypothetical protein
MQIGVWSKCHHAQLPSPDCRLRVSDRTLVILVDAFNSRLAGNSAYIVALRSAIQDMWVAKVYRHIRKLLRENPTSALQARTRMDILSALPVRLNFDGI